MVMSSIASHYSFSVSKYILWSGSFIVVAGVENTALLGYHLMTLEGTWTVLSRCGGVLFFEIIQCCPIMQFSIFTSFKEVNSNLSKASRVNMVEKLQQLHCNLARCHLFDIMVLNQ